MTVGCDSYGGKTMGRSGVPHPNHTATLLLRVGVCAASLWICAACALAPASTVPWSVMLSAAVVTGQQPTLFSFSGSVQTQQVLQVSGDVLLSDTRGSSTSSNGAVVAAVWVAPELSSALQLDAASPEPSLQPMYTRLQPGKGWVLVADGSGAGPLTLDTSIPLLSAVAANGENCVLTLAWEDAQGRSWEQRFAVGGARVGRTVLVSGGSL